MTTTHKKKKKTKEKTTTPNINPNTPDMPPPPPPTTRIATHITPIQVVSPKPTFKFNNQALVCVPLTADTHKTITNILKDNNLDFFTHDINALRPVKIAIKYIPVDIPNEDIAHDLNNKNLPFIQISRIMITRDGKKQPSNILILTIPQSSAETYYKITDLCSLKISVSEYIRQDIPQCHRCQRFGHSSMMCNRAHKCVRCGLTHEGKQCSAEGCMCANCGGQNPANYRGCPAYLAAKTRALKQKIPPPTPSHPTPTPVAGPSTIESTETTNTRTNIQVKQQYKPAPIPKTNPWTKQTNTNKE